MNLFPWKPIRLTFDLDQQIERAFSELIDEKWGKAGGEGWHPAIDIFDVGNAYLIEAELPGIQPEDVEVLVEDSWVTICGTRRSTQRVQSGQQIWTERRHGSFCRKFLLQEPVDTGQISVTQQEGVYHIRLPKRRSAGTSEH